MTAPNPYDLIPYDAASVPCTRPEQLALRSWIAGGPRPALDGYRVLEVGCANGANLLPLAYFRPDVQAIGIDASAGQIAAARAAAEALGITNVEFLQLDLRELPAREDLACDFLIAHGVLSWVPADAKRALLAGAGRLLRPSGLAFISFNTHPGWKMRGTLREFFLPELSGIEDVAARAERARELGGEFRELLSEEVEHPYCRLLRYELKLLAETATSHVAHDYFEQDNDPLDFWEFDQRLEEHGLEWVGEADFDPNLTTSGGMVRGTLEEAGLTGRLLEQSVDLLTYNQLHTPILCRAGERRTAPSAAAIFAEPTLTIRARLEARAEGAPIDLTPGVEVTFVDAVETEYSLADPLLKATLSELLEAGHRRLLSRELIERATARVREAGISDGDPTDVEEMLLFFFNRGQLELRLRDEPIPEPRPAPDVRESASVRVGPLTRIEAARGKLLTTPRHTHLPIDDFDRYLIGRLDGSVTRRDLLVDLEQLGRAGAIVVEGKDGIVKDPSELKATLAETYEWLIGALTAEGLLQPLP